MGSPVKVSDSVIIMEKVTPEVRTTVTYERGFIEKQILNIQSQKDAYDAQRDAEIKECQDILKAMDDLGIKATEPTGVMNGN